MNPEISVLIPTHGNGEFITECFQSIESQIYRDFEVVLVDDGCNFDLIDKAKNIFINTNFLIIKSEGNGVSDALNTGLKLCKGKYIARFDSDDVMNPNRLSTQITLLNANSKIVLMGSNIDLIDKYGNYLASDFFPERHNRIIKEFTKRNPFAHPSVIFNKDLVIAIGGYRKFFEPAEDFDLWLRISNLGELQNVPKSLIKYRLHEKQVTKNRNNESEIAVQAALTSYRLSFVGINNYVESFNSAIEWYQSVNLESLMVKKTYDTKQSKMRIVKIKRIYSILRKIRKNPIWAVTRFKFKLKIWIRLLKHNMNFLIQERLGEVKDLRNPKYYFWITCACLLNPLIISRLIFTKLRQKIYIAISKIVSRKS